MAKRTREPATIVDIARRVGVSAMTVSRALTGSPDVSEKTRARVLRCAQAMGYRPNRWARSLVTRRSAIVGVVVPDIGHSYFAEVTRGIEEVLDRAHYDLVLCHSNLDVEKERGEIDMLIGSQVDGLIVASEQPLDSPDLFIDLKSRKIPFVLIDRFFPGHDFPGVRVDDLAAGRMATEYLIDLGHTRIAFIDGRAMTPAALRRQGYLDALEAHRIPVRDEYILPGCFDIESGREAMRRILDLDPSPTAVFAANDPMAVGAIYAGRDAGIAIPRDLSIVGAGNIEGEYHPNPFLTTVDWPRNQLGRDAASMLLSMIVDGKRPKAEVLAPRMLMRQSTARLLSVRRAG